MKRAAKAALRPPTFPPEQPILVRLSKYAELTGDTADAVHARRKTGQWTDGRQCLVGPDHRVWIDLLEAQAWVRNGR